MIRQIAPQFFTTDIPGTVAYYKNKLGFECLGTWLDPPVYAIVTREQHAIHFRCAAPPTANPDKYADELLDAYFYVEDADALYAEYAAHGVEFQRELGNTPWRSREFVVKDCDGSAGLRRELVTSVFPQASTKSTAADYRLRVDLRERPTCVAEPGRAARKESMVVVAKV